MEVLLKRGDTMLALAMGGILGIMIILEPRQMPLDKKVTIIPRPISLADTANSATNAANSNTTMAPVRPVSYSAAIGSVKSPPPPSIQTVKNEPMRIMARPRNPSANPTSPSIDPSRPPVDMAEKQRLYEEARKRIFDEQ